VSCGLEWGSLQAQESAARALLLDPDCFTPSMAELARDRALAMPPVVAPVFDSEATRDCEPDVMEVRPIPTATTEDAAKAAWLSKQKMP